MTATVTSLTARRVSRSREETCRYCRPGFVCGPHQLYDLGERLRRARGTDLMDEALTDALAVIDQITADVLSRDERTTR